MPTLADTVVNATAALNANAQQYFDLESRVALRESAAVQAGGYVLDPNDTSELARAVSRGTWLDMMGQAANVNTLTGVIQGQVLWPALRIGMEFSGFINAPNTGPVTVALTGFVNAPGPIPLLTRSGAPLASGDIPASVPFRFRFDGTSFRIGGSVNSDVQTIIQNGWGFQALLTPGSGFFTVPAGVTKIEATGWAGGGGSNASGSSTIYTAGASGGGYFQKLIGGLIPGQQIPYVLGAGGLAVPAGSTGGNGGPTSFGSYASATGGNGSSATPTAGVAGGFGTGGDDNRQGEGGGGSISNVKAGDGGGAGGGGGTRAPGGNGGTNPGNFPGGGAAGAPPNTAGAAGAPGAIYLRWRAAA